MLLKTLLGLLFLGLIAVPGARADDCAKTDHLSARDKDTIVTLARRVGMSGPLRICGDYFAPPIGCQAIRVDSLPRIEGIKRSWQSLYMGRSAEGKRTCPWWTRDSTVYRQGGWVAASSNRGDVTVWRFTAGLHLVDAQLGPGISDAQANLIIQALHDLSWQDGLDEEGRSLMAEWNREPSWIEQISSIYGDQESGYDVRAGETGGLLIHVTVKGSVVTLTQAGLYAV